MSLRLEAVERIFTRLTATYGREFTGKWDGQEIAPVKSLWAHELAAFNDQLKCIAWALENLPAKAPNLIEFKQLCRQAPRDMYVALDGPKVDRTIVDAEMAKIAASALKPKAEGGKVDYRAWAKRLKARHDSGEKLGMYQISKYREALGLDERAAA